MEKTVVVLGVCLLLTLSVFSGCEDVPKEITPLSIVSFIVEPSTIKQGKHANLSWVVIGATSLNIDNGIGNVTLTGNLIIQPTQTTTYILTALNATSTKSAAATITIIPPIPPSYDDRIAIGDCADVSYIGRYTSNNTIFDKSYQYAENKSGGSPLKVFISYNASATSPKSGYTAGMFKGFMEGLIGMQEGQTKTIGPIPPEKAYGANKLKVGDSFHTKMLTASNTNYQLNQTVTVVKMNSENITLKWLNVEDLGNFTMPEGILLADLGQIVMSPYDYVPPYYLWLNSSQVTSITNEMVLIKTTPTKAWNITDKVTFVSTGDKIGYIFPDATTAVWNESTITIQSSPVKGAKYLMPYGGEALNISVGNVTQTHINISVDYQGQKQDIQLNRTISFNRTYSLRRIYVLSMTYASYIIGQDIEKAGYSLNPLAGESLTFEVTIEKIYKTIK